MKVLITGAKGFIGRNLVSKLKYHKGMEVYEFDLDGDIGVLNQYCQDCGFVYNLAGVNRSTDESEFMSGNCDFLLKLVTLLKNNHNACPVMLSSSIQAEIQNPYGESKAKGEAVLRRYADETGAKAYIYRFPNLFGKWCRPNYNSVVATFCHNIVRGLPIKIHEPEKILDLVYIEDAVDSMADLLEGKSTLNEYGFCDVAEHYFVSIKELANLIYSFKRSGESLYVPDLSENGLTKKLYSTYLSYLPEEQFSHPLKMNINQRGSFTEMIRTRDRGQFSVNISNPGSEKGNHWHRFKHEKFVVVRGRALIQLRQVGEDKIIEYRVSGENLEVIDIPPGYTHNIINEGQTDLITFMWCSDCFDQKNPDTYSLPVNQGDGES